MERENTQSRMILRPTAIPERNKPPAHLRIPQKQQKSPSNLYLPNLEHRIREPDSRASVPHMLSRLPVPLDPLRTSRPSVWTLSLHRTWGGGLVLFIQLEHRIKDKAIRTPILRFPPPSSGPRNTLLPIHLATARRGRRQSWPRWTPQIRNQSGPHLDGLRHPYAKAKRRCIPRPSREPPQKSLEPEGGLRAQGGRSRLEEGKREILELRGIKKNYLGNDL
jgi:hypothetical protein